MVNTIKTIINGIKCWITGSINSIKKNVDSIKENVDLLYNRVETLESKPDFKQVQTDWEQHDASATDYLKNKPFGEGLPADLGTYNFVATSINTIECQMSVNDGSYDILNHLYNHVGISDATSVMIDGRYSESWTSSFNKEYGRLNAHGNNFDFECSYHAGSIAKITCFQLTSFTTGNTYKIHFQDVSDDSVRKIALQYIPNSVYTSENAPVKFGSGSNSTVQGSNTIASATNSHAEGSGTIASCDNQHVQGIYNVEDTWRDFLHIVGNGTIEKRSNAYALDKNGNAYYKGTVYVNGTAANALNGKEVATKKYVDDNTLPGYPVNFIVRTSAELTPNIYYKWGEIAALTITLAEPTNTDKTNEYCFEFVSGETPTTLSVPDTVKWVKEPNVEAGKTYQVSILNGIGVICGA